MSNVPIPPTPPRDWAATAASAALGFALGATVTLAAGWLLANHLQNWPALDVTGFWDWARWSALVLFADSARAGAGDWLPWLQLSAAAAATAGTFVATLAFRYTAPPQAEQHLRGRQLSADARKCAQEMEDGIKVSGEGIKLHPNITISIDRETRGFLILGSIGGGKTQIINHLINQILERDDKALVFDNKGDFTQGLLGLPGVALIAPWDRRGLAWNVALDCVTKSDATELASRLIPESSDPTWSNGARQILAALIAHAQRSAAGAWSFATIATLAGQEYEQLRAVCLSADPKLHLLLPQKPTKTTQSFLSQLVVFMGQVFALADAWSDTGHGSHITKVSLRNWLLNPQSPEQSTRVLIMQSHGRYAKLAQAYIQSIISAVASVVNSPDLPDSKTRRIWLLLDEFPQIGRVENIEKFIEIGRSKGVRTIAAAQDINQIRATYTPEWANALSSMVGTVIACRTQGAETPQWLSQLVGGRQVKRYSPTFSAPVSGLGGYAAVPTRADNWITADEPVVSPDEFGLLGPSPDGVTALLIPGGSFVYRLTWPFTRLPNSAEPTVPAPWTQPGWPSSADQAAQTVAEIKVAEDTDDDASNTAPPTPPSDDRQPPRPAAHNPAQETTAFDMLPADTEQHEQPEPEAGEAEKTVTEAAKEAVNELAGELLPEPLTAVLEVAEVVEQLQEQIPAAETTPAPVPVPRKIKVRRRKTPAAELENEQC